MKISRRIVMGGLATSGLAMVTRSEGAEHMRRDVSHLNPEQRARYDAGRARMKAAFPYEHVTVVGAQALAEWERLKDAGRGWPVVIGNDEDLDDIMDQFSMDDPVIGGATDLGARSTAQIVDDAKGIRFPADLQNWSGAYRPEDLRAPLGEWPTAIEPGDSGLSVALDLMTGQFHDQVHIVLLPTKNGWEVPAYLRWGNWNACPPPEYHVAALRDWHDRFGVDLVGINGDTMNMRARVKVGERQQALSLARDLYGYCPDIVDQGVGSITVLAAGLMSSEWWDFWWD